jgi:predicted acyltransferase
MTGINAFTEANPAPSGATSRAARVISVDALRGLVMLTMVFVNDVAGVRAAPWWMKHFPGDKSGMTFVDVVFPAFLFVVGLSIPLAIESRRARGQAWTAIFGHVLLRTISLLCLGVLMVKSPDPAQMGWPPHLWQVLMFSAAVVAFSDLPNLRALRLLGLAVLIWLALVFRARDGMGLATEWWGILGLIGWAYLAASMLYLALKRDRAWMVGAVGALICMYFAQSRGLFDTWPISNWLNLGEQIGGHGAIVMAGVVLGSILLPSSDLPSHAARLRFAFVFAIILAVAGWLLVPTYGINKNSATPSWCLYCAAITCALWALTYLLVDALRLRWLSSFFVIAGTNALLIYLLHPLFYHALSLANVTFYNRLGAGELGFGIARSIGLAIVLTAFAGMLKRAGLRLRL